MGWHKHSSKIQSSDRLTTAMVLPYVPRGQLWMDPQCGSITLCMCLVLSMRHTFISCASVWLDRRIQMIAIHMHMWGNKTHVYTLQTTMLKSPPHAQISAACSCSCDVCELFQGQLCMQRTPGHTHNVEPWHRICKHTPTRLQHQVSTDCGAQA